MPPARKKGVANNNDNNTNIKSNSSSNLVKSATELQLGDLVLAKVQGFPAWPAKVSRPEDWERTPDPKKYFVQFFGTQEIAFVAPADIQAFTSESKAKLLARCKGKIVKYFAQAVKEICEAFEELQKHGDIKGALKHDASDVNDEKINGFRVESTTLLKSGESCQSNSVLDRAYLFCNSAIGDKQPASMKGSIADRHEKIKMKKESEIFSPGHVQGVLTAPFLFSPIGEGKTLDEKKTVSARRERIEPSRTLSSTPYGSDSDVERNPSYHTAGTKDTIMPPGASRHLKSSSGEDKKSSIRDRSKDLKVGEKRKVEGTTCRADDAKSGVFFGDGMLGKVSAGEHAKRLASNLNKFELKTQGKASNNLFKGSKLSDGAKSSLQNLVTNAEGHLDGRHPRQKNDQTGNEQSLSVKKAKLVARMSFATKGSVLKDEKNELETEMLVEEAVPPEVMPRHHVLDGVYNEGTRSLGIASLKNDVLKKRRAVRLCDDGSDDEPKTPVHGGSMKSGLKVSSSVLMSDSAKNTNEKNESPNCAGQNFKGANRDEGASQKNYYLSANPIGKSSRGATLSQRADSSTKANVSHSPGFDKRVVKETKTDLISPTKSPQVVAAMKKSVDQQLPNRPFNRMTNSVAHSKAQFISGKDPNFMSGGSNSSQSLVAAQKSRKPLSGERARVPPKTGVMLIEPAASLDEHRDHDPEFDRRLEDTRDNSGSLVDSKASDKSMKNLIAQAKKRQAHMQNVPTGGGDSVMAPSANLLGMHPSPSSTNLAFHSGEVNVTQLDAKGVESRGSFGPPSGGDLRSSYEESEEKELSLGPQSAGSTLSGGTEAAVVRDAFEGMIETLSRTKESIGRATRLAIDCAKYGIANEIVDLLIHKLENESSFHRRVDLFFLVDSITQCSHGQKGVAGVSYLPTVQAALPRLLGAAAPPGPNARENRRQCLKVLRLWLERKILPESVLRRFMDDIGGANDDTSIGPSFRRPSRANRSVDDPIREMEGMFVDEYGSNATFNLPGFLSTQGFVDDEEDEDDVPSKPRNPSEALLLQPCTNASIGPETGKVTPNDRCHHVLEDVDGELEMEDVSEHRKDGALSRCGLSKKDEQEMQLDTVVDTSTDDIVEPLSLDGSPPLPLESPPPLPPLPSSPPPPPPPPLSPSPPPPPPPPPPLTLPSQPPLPSLLPSGPPQYGNLQHLIPSQLPVTPQVVMHLPVAIPTVQGGHVQMAGNTSQQVPRFMPAGAPISRSLEYGQSDMYPGPQAGPSNQQFQQNRQFQLSSTTFVQRAFPPASLPQPPLGPFAYNKPPVQHNLPHPGSHLPAFPPPPSHPYSSSNSDGLRLFNDEQWRSVHVEYKPDNHHNAWVNGAQMQSCPTTTFSGEAYFRHPERAPTDNLGHHASAPNSSLQGPAAAGLNQMLPSRPDMSLLNSWRPA